jgi:DNA-binding NtrC family response regulator
MPARIVVVMDEPGFAEKAAEQLAAAGYDAIALADSMVALDALEDAVRIELLITSFGYRPGRPNGIALARIARLKRPKIKVIFVGEPQLVHYTAGLGAFLQSPVTVSQLVETIIEVMKKPES